MLSELTDEQAAYIGVPKQGPYKPDTYPRAANKSLLASLLCLVVLIPTA